MSQKVIMFDGNNYMRRMYEVVQGDSALRATVNNIRNAIIDARGIFVWDGANSNKYRRDKYPAYKAQRPTTPDSINEHRVLLKRILKLLPIISIEVPEYEADDVIGAIVNQMKDDDYDIHIESTDKDFQQLGVSFVGKPLPVPAEEVVLYKTLVGDGSDNITGIPGFGRIKYADLNKVQALKWLDNDFASQLTPPMAERFVIWITTHKDELIAMRDVCRFRPVPDELIQKHAVFGTPQPDFDGIEAILKEIMA